MPRLVDLEPRFIRAEIRVETWRRVRPGADPLNYTEADVEDFTGPREYQVSVETLDQAHGIFFLCPLCFVANGGAIGTHGVVVGFVNRAPPGTLSRNDQGEDSRWNVSGSTFHDLTLSPSVHLTGEGCGWHGFVTNGVAA